MKERHIVLSVCLFIILIALVGCAMPAEPSDEPTSSSPSATDGGTEDADAAEETAAEGTDAPVTTAEPAETDAPAPDTQPDTEPETETAPEEETWPPAPEGIAVFGKRREKAVNVAAAVYTGCSVDESGNVLAHLEFVRWYRGMDGSGLPGWKNEAEADMVVFDPNGGDVSVWPIEPDSVDTSFIPYEVGKTYLFVMNRSIHPNPGMTGLSTTYTSLVIPADNVAASTMNGDPLIWYMKDVDSLHGMTVDDLGAWFAALFEGKTYYGGVPFLPSEDMGEIVNYADDVVVAVMESMAMDLMNPIAATYRLRVQRVIKGECREGETITVFMNREDFREGETVLIAMTDPPEGVLLCHYYAAPRCIWPASEADAVMSSLK